MLYRFTPVTGWVSHPARGAKPRIITQNHCGINHGGARMARYIFITGGVVSSLGKGLASAALGALLQARGFSVRLRKLDPYPQRRSRHHVALRAWRGLRHR